MYFICGGKKRGLCRGVDAVGFDWAKSPWSDASGYQVKPAPVTTKPSDVFWCGDHAMLPPGSIFLIVWVRFDQTSVAVG